MAPFLWVVCWYHLCRFQGVVKTANPSVLYLAQCSRSALMRNPEVCTERESISRQSMECTLLADSSWMPSNTRCPGGYKAFRKSQKSSLISDLDQQYINYIFSVVLLAFASHPSGDLVSALEFPFLYFYRFHSGCCASGILGFVLMLTTVKLKSSQSSAHYASWNFLSKVVTAGLSPLVFDITLNAPTLCCLLLGAVGEALMVYSDRTGA